MAAADERIDDLVNRSKVKGDIDFVTDLLEKVFNNIEKINKMKIDIGGAKGMAETARAAEAAAKAADDMAKSTAKVKQANDEIEKSLQGVNRQWLANAADIKDNIALQVQYEAELRKVKTLLASAESTGNTTKIVEYRQKALELKAAISELDRTTKYQAQSNNALEDTFKRMSLELGNMRTLYKSLTTAEKASADFGIPLKKNIEKLDAEVKKIEASLGNFQRNVGNYKSGFNGLNVSISQMLRELPAFTFSVQTGLLGLSNNFPMLFDEIGKVNTQVKALRAEGQKVPGTFAQIVKNLLSFQSALSVGVLLLTLYGDKIAKWATDLFKGSEKMSEIQQTQKLFNTALGEGNGEYAKAVQSLTQLRSNIDLAKKGLIDKKDVLKEYNEGIGKTVGQVDSLREAEEKLMKNGDAYIKFVLLKATAQLASEEASKKMLEALKLRQKDVEEFATVGDRFEEGLSSGYFNQLTKAGATQRFVADQQRKLAAVNRKDAEVKVVEDEKNTLENIFKELNTKAAELAKKYKFSFYGTDGDGKNAKDKIFKDGDDIRKALFESQKLTLEESIRTKDSIVKDEKQSFLLRIKAAKEYLAGRLALNKREFDYKNEDIDAKEKEDIKQAENEYKNEEEKNKRIDYIRKAAAANRLLAEKEYGIGEKRIKEEYYGDYLKQLEDYLKNDKKKREDNEKDLLDIELEKAETKYIEATTTLDNRYAKEIAAAKNNKKEKERIEREYQKESARLLRDYNVEILTITINDGKKQIEALQEVWDATGNEEDWNRLAAARTKIAQLEVKLAKYVAEAKKKANKEAKDQTDADEMEMEEKLKYLSSQAVSVFSSVSDIVGARYEREKNLIEQQIELIEKKKQADIDAINASADTEEKKAARVKLVEAKAQAQREQLERRQRLLDQKKARFQKYVAIATIIQDTAIAVMKAFADYGWVGAIAAGALGAAKLAAVIATPIPQYKTGTGDKDHPGGPFIAGDGGKKELVVEPSGQAYVTADKPTLYQGPKGTKVYPDAERAMEAVNARAKSYAPFVIIKKEGEPVDMSAILGQKLDRLNNSIKNKKELHLSITRYGTHLAQQSGYNFRDYLNRNLQS